MALGGGKWTSQNKELPGAYINNVSATSASATLSDRGVCTLPMELDWGVEGDVFKVTNEDLQKDSLKIFGYEYTDEHLKGLRDLFLNAKILYAYRLNGGGDKASNDFATAKYCGIRGNNIKIAIQANADEPTKFDVATYVDTTKVDEQTVAKSEELIDNDYVTFKKDAVLAITAATTLTGGTNGEVNGQSYQAYANKIESYRYNTMGIVSTDETIIRLFNAFNKRLRDEEGIKFQLVTFRNTAADYLGIISVKNKVLDEGWSEASLVYWVSGAECGCEVQKTCEAKEYDGEFTVDTDYTQADLKQCIKEGQLVLHKVNENIEVLVDINTMVTTSEECGDVFKENQTVRVIDQLGNDDALLFNTKYRGKIPNKEDGRSALWLDLVKIREELQKIGAIEDFKDSDVTVEPGDTKKAVVVNSAITVVNAMSKLYMINVVQ